MVPRLALSLLLCVAYGVAAVAQDPAPAPDPEDTPAAPEPQIDEKSQQTLQQLRQTLQKADSVTYNSKLAMRIEAGEQKRDVVLDYDVATQEPNKLHVLIKGEPVGGELSVISTGEKFHTYSASEKKYTQQDAPAAIGDLLVGEYFMPNDPALGFMISFAEREPLAYLTEGASAKYIGTDTVNGVEAHHIRFEEPQMTWSLWVRTGDQPVPVQVKPEFPQMPDARIDMTISFSDWNLAADVPADRFTFTPPEGATEMAMDAAQGEEEAPHTLLGKAAPAFTLDLLQGGEMDLARHKGKDIVILDFWATWCGPCRQAMPVIDRVAEQFKDRNVVLYAVNLREKPEEINKFLQDQKLDVPVALDTQGSVADQYGVEGIPQTVIIGKDGTVQAVHEGFGRGLESSLTEELEALASGQSLLEGKEEASSAEGTPKS